MKYLVIYERSKTGYGAYIPDLPGCVAVAKTLPRVKRLIRSACKMHLDAMRADGDPIPAPTTRSDYLDLAG